MVNQTGPESQTILVVGGGIASITSTVAAAAECGYDVILLKKSPALGGRVARFGGAVYQLIVTEAAQTAIGCENVYRHIHFSLTQRQAGPQPHRRRVRVQCARPQDLHDQGARGGVRRGRRDQPLAAACTG